MSDQAVIALLAGLAIGAAVVGAVTVVRRRWRGGGGLGGGLGGDGEHATYRTLHLASRAADHLRNGIAGGESDRAARHLRTLLGCDILVIADLQGSVAVDGPAGYDAAAALDGFVEEAVERTRSTGRSQVTAVQNPPIPGAACAITAPIITDGAVAGVVIAFASERRATLIRATGEVAGWVSAQLGLRELDASRAALAEAEVKALRAQISPHFIYNALNAIASFINTDPAKARELVLEFADFTRYSFRRHGEFTTLAEELRSIHSYLLLERARFGDRLQVRLQIAPETLSAIIPFLSLQPLVENAVRHGLESKEGGGTISIVSEDAGPDVQVTIEDDGAGIDPEALEALLAGKGSGDHVGLLNVDTRLRQVYGDAYGLVVETNVGAGTLVRVLVPRSQPMHDPIAASPGDRWKTDDRSSERLPS
ncbi:MAG: hypothetical protein RI885_188 [Actinomycetota bacterium]|jgi:two-component system LytT family sensor kinase